ncbi:MAG: NADH-quinone oxidoreductase subunit L [Myxococcales bacterium]|nr:NADH-quinone oxidoreductase subunit L [Myxococcales bacterium]
MIDCTGYQSFGQFLQGHGFGDTFACFFQKAPAEPEAMAGALWLIIALPLLGAVVCGLLGKSLGKANTALVACMSVAASFVLSVLAFWVTSDHDVLALNPFAPEPSHYSIAQDYGTWFAAGGFRAQLGLRVDHLSGTMLLVVTGVGFLIHLYSAEYMGHDEGQWRYFSYLNLFVAMMLLLVLADGMALLFVGWEGVGLCSYLLIGFWYSDPAKAFAGRKAFVVNRIGDFGFLVGMFLLVLMVEAFSHQASPDSFAPRGPYAPAAQVEKWRLGLAERGPLNFQGLEELARSLTPKANPGAIGLSTPIRQGPLEGHSFGGVLTAVLLLFLLGAAGKSAQLPLYVWLPDAMAGPTPVSALIHAATMVTAGVYMFCRLSFLVALSPTAMAAIALLGGLTALWSALIAFAQDDIKKVLAYSTISQLGVMFIGVGVGLFWAALLHLATHAAFKAALFLGAGSVMHGNGDETDIKRLGGLRHRMKWTWATFGVATVAITGVLPLSGFFSKDAILHGAHSATLLAYPGLTRVVWLLGLATAACTAFYMFRLYLLVFEGERARDAKLPEEKVKESGRAMTVPLVVLAVLSVGLVFHGLPLPYGGGQLRPMMEDYLSPVFRTSQLIFRETRVLEVHSEPSLPYGAWLTALLLAWAGLLLALYFYRKLFPSWAGKPAPALAKAIRTFAQNKFYVDEAYELLLVRPVKFLSFISYKVVDSLLIDALAVRGTAWVTLRVGAALRYLQSGDVQSYAAVMALALAAGIAYVLIRVAS